MAHHILKEISASQDIRRMFSSRSLAPKPFTRCFRADNTKLDLKVIAKDQEYELLGYAALYWVSHLQKISRSDMTALLPSVLKFFHSGHAFLNWICAYGIATRGMKSVVSDAKALVSSSFPVESTMLNSMVNILVLATPAHSSDIFDGQVNDIDDHLCRIMFDAVLEPRTLALTTPLENYNKNELELTLARFMFKDFDVLYLQESMELYDADESIIRCRSKLADTRGTYPCQLRLQFFILLTLVLVYKCFKILDQLLAYFPIALAKELQILFDFAITVNSDDMLEHALKRRVVLHGNIKPLLISTIHANSPGLLSLLLCRSPPPADTWADHDEILGAAVESGNEEILETLLTSVNTMSQAPMKGSLDKYLLMAVIQSSPSVFVTLLRSYAPSHVEYEEALNLASEIGEPKFFQFLLNAIQFLQKSMQRN